MGGTADLCATLAKRAMLRPIGTHNEDPLVAALEDELFALANELGIGPMGLGGRSTCWRCISNTPTRTSPRTRSVSAWSAGRAPRQRARHTRTARSPTASETRRTPSKRGKERDDRPPGTTEGTLTSASRSTSPTRCASCRPANGCGSTASIFGLRDATHIAMFDRGERPRADLRGAAVLHTAPNVRVLPDGRYEKLCIGTTTSARMSRFTRPIMSEYGVRAIMGKAGLLPDTLPVLAEFGGVYLALVGGSAALETTQIEAIEGVEFEQYMPECLWRFRVREFGPLFVAMDSHGGSLFEAVKSTGGARLEQLAARL